MHNHTLVEGPPPGVNREYPRFMLIAQFYHKKATRQALHRIILDTSPPRATIEEAWSVSEGWNNRKEDAMKYGARNQIFGTVKSVKSDDVMSLAKFEVKVPCEMASVLTTESVQAMNMKPGDQVTLVVKAIHVLPVKE